MLGLLRRGLGLFNAVEVNNSLTYMYIFENKIGKENRPAKIMRFMINFVSFSTMYNTTTDNYNKH